MVEEDLTQRRRGAEGRKKRGEQGAGSN